MPAEVNRIQKRATSLGVNWWVWRLVQSPDIPDGLVAIRRGWTFADTLVAHIAQDALDDSRAFLRRRDERRRKRPRR